MFSTQCSHNVHTHFDTQATAIIWEGDDPDVDQHISYKQLHVQVCKLSNVLKSRGVKKGDRVSIYSTTAGLPVQLIAELATWLRLVFKMLFDTAGSCSFAERRIAK